MGVCRSTVEDLVAVEDLSAVEDLEPLESLTAAGDLAAVAQLDFYRGKRVFVTGHTGFKGAWLLRILKLAGADVCGYALEPPTNPSLFEISDGACGIRHVVGDIRDFGKLLDTVREFGPEIVIHMAAQPIVLEGYRNPRETYETNVMGTVNLLEVVRLGGTVRSLVNVTTDKVYRNAEDAARAYREEDILDGFDPYSNSKSCADLLTGAYARSFLTDAGCAASTVRAGNVIGGGDFAMDRIVPDCVRAVCDHKPVIVRNPCSVRPYQHVLEPLFAYMLIAQRQWEDASLAGAFNVGPEPSDCLTTQQLVELFADKLPLEIVVQNRDADGGVCRVAHEAGDGDVRETANEADNGACGGAHETGGNIARNAAHEATFLKLDSSKMNDTFGWHPRWNAETAIDAVAEWTQAWLAGEDVRPVMDAQINSYLKSDPTNALDGNLKSSLDNDLGNDSENNSDGASKNDLKSNSDSSLNRDLEGA